MSGPLSLMFNWTSAGNYPSGPKPWNGNPLGVAPSGTFFTPDTKPSAENFNYLLGLITSDLTTLNTYLAHAIAGAYAPYAITTTGIIVPQNCFWMGALLWGGGGGGEGGNQGETNPSGIAANVYPQGGGGAGAPLVAAMFPTNPGDTIKVTVGTGGPGGAGPGGFGHGAQGLDGLASKIECTAGALSGVTFATARGGSGAGCGPSDGSGENWTGGAAFAFSTDGLPTIASLVAAYLGSPTLANLANLVGATAGGFYGMLGSQGAIAPGAVGMAKGTTRRLFPFSLGPYRVNTAGSSGDFDLGRYIEGVPQRGGSVAVIGSGGSVGACSATRLSTSGEPSVGTFLGGPFAGGAGGSNGTNNAPNYGGIGGGGGGAGPLGPGGAGGNGGQGIASGTGIGGGPGGNGGGGAGNTSSGAGGGGGGGGGWGSVAGGQGGVGGAGDSGFVHLFYFSGPPSPP
jgi:hypothetical protein